MMTTIRSLQQGGHQNGDIEYELEEANKYDYYEDNDVEDECVYEYDDAKDEEEYGEEDEEDEEDTDDSDDSDEDGDEEDVSLYNVRDSIENYDEYDNVNDEGDNMYDITSGGDQEENEAVLQTLIKSLKLENLDDDNVSNINDEHEDIEN